MFKVDNKNSGIKTFFLATVFNRGQCFLEGKSFLIALEERLHALQKYNVFDSYFYLRHILIQKEHLSHIFEWLRCSFRRAFAVI